MRYRTLASFIMVAVALVMIAEVFLDVKAISSLASEIKNWGVIMSILALGLAAANLIRQHTQRISARRPKWGQSVLLLAGLAVFAALGVSKGTASPAYLKYYNMIVPPVSGAMFSLLSFFTISAGYRAFRARNLDAAIILIVGVIVMLGQVPVGEALSTSIPKLRAWIIATPNAAGQRGLIIGAAVGAMAHSLKMLFGVERAHLGAGNQ